MCCSRHPEHLLSATRCVLNYQHFPCSMFHVSPPSSARMLRAKERLQPMDMRRMRDRADVPWTFRFPSLSNPPTQGSRGYRVLMGGGSFRRQSRPLPPVLSGTTAAGGAGRRFCSLCPLSGLSLSSRQADWQMSSNSASIDDQDTDCQTRRKQGL